MLHSPAIRTTRWCMLRVHLLLLFPVRVFGVFVSLFLPRRNWALWRCERRVVITFVLWPGSLGPLLGVEVCMYKAMGRARGQVDRIMVSA